MRQIWDFPGGIHPVENKTQSTRQPIQEAGIPPVLVIPLAQHIGAQAKCIVEVGQHVLKGQLLAEATGKISVPVHAPTSGHIEAIQDHAIAHPSGMSDQCVILKPDGKDTWIERQVDRDYTLMSKEQILAMIRDRGLAGMGGAGFPTEVKLHPPKEDKVQILIINAAECEPYITADDMLMREQARRIVAGIEIMASVLEPEECVIGIEDNKPEAIAELQKAVAGTRIEVVVIPTKYPSGGEKQLVKILTDLEIPKGKIPADIGVMCQNVGTAAAVYDAIAQDIPLISRVVTITGHGVQAPRNYLALIGTPVAHLLELAGYDPGNTDRLIIGGPMMGFMIEHAQVPVVKTTNCVIAAGANEVPAPHQEQACIRCGYCVEACPMGLLPQQLFWFSKNKEFDKAALFNLPDCIECGACSYVCPSSIPLVQYYRFAKGEIRQQAMDKEKADKARLRFEFRQERLDREAAEKEAKRKERAAAAAKAQAEKLKAAKEESIAAPDAQADQAPKDKKAAIAEAVARAQQKKVTATVEAAEPEPLPDLAKLKDDVAKAEAKLEKMKDAALGIDPSDTAAQEKMARAVSKNEARVTAAQKALAEAEKQAAADTATPPATTHD